MNHAHDTPASDFFNSLLELPDLHIKLLMNHAIPEGDYHSGYYSKKLENLRASSQRIADWLINVARPPKAKRKAKQASNIIEMKAA